MGDGALWGLREDKGNVIAAWAKLRGLEYASLYKTSAAEIGNAHVHEVSVKGSSRGTQSEHALVEQDLV